MLLNLLGSPRAPPTAARLPSCGSGGRMGGSGAGGAGRRTGRLGGGAVKVGAAVMGTSVPTAAPPNHPATPREGPGSRDQGDHPCRASIVPIDAMRANVARQRQQVHEALRVHAHRPAQPHRVAGTGGRPGPRSPRAPSALEMSDGQVSTKACRSAAAFGAAREMVTVSVGSPRGVEQLLPDLL